jgi:thymidine kinase
MFSGKSSELQRRVRRNVAIGKRVLVVNHSDDNRYGTGETVVTHDGGAMKALKINHIRDIDPKNVEIIAIDEGHFFEDIEIVRNFISKNISVIIAGLSSDYKQEKIGKLLDLIPCSDDVTMLKALCGVCNDGTPGAFTKKKEATRNEKRVETNGGENVGGKEKYIAVCRKCHSKE